MTLGIRALMALLIGACSSTGLALAQGAGITPTFTYQGSLVQNDQPATGDFDFIFAFYNAPSDGSSQAFTTLQNVPVENGVFTVELTPMPSNPFEAGDEIYIEVSVRASGTQDYETLAGRQRVTPTPYAQVAGTSIDRGFYRPFPGATSLITDGAVDRVLFNRPTAISSAEFFGFTAPTTGNGFGGMYVNTTSTTSRPFYGFAVEGSVLGWTQLSNVEPTRSAWSVVIANTSQLEVDSTGTLTTGDVVASSYAYDTVRRETVSIPAAAFRPESSSDPFIFDLTTGSMSGASGAAVGFYAPLQLPAGVVLREIKLTALDSVSTGDDIQATLWRTLLGVSTSPAVMGGVVTNVSPTPIVTSGALDGLVGGDATYTVDNDDFAYFVTVRVLNTPTNTLAAWRNGLAFYAVQITYDVTELR